MKNKILIFFILILLQGCYVEKMQKSFAAPIHKKAVKEVHIFKNSDVIGFTRSSFKNYVDYGVNFVSWGGYPSADKKSQYRFRKNIAQAYQKGVKIGAKIGIRTNFKGFIDFAPNDFLNSRCKNIAGTPVLVPAMEKHKYKGHFAYWFCTNSPLFQKYLESNIKRAVEGNPYGIMIDDPLGTAAAALWFGGCYCEYCVKGFQEYLKQNYTLETLKKMGINHIENFDLLAYHKNFENFPISERPLRKEIIEFQLQKSVELFSHLTVYAQNLRGEAFPISANLNPATKVGGRFFKKLDYFSTECSMGANTNSLDNSLSLNVFKIGDAINRPVAIMGSGTDHAHIAKEKLPGMVQCWVAEAYANGGFFLAPIKLWAYSKEKGSHHYIPESKDEIAPLYKFIKKNYDVFDDFKPCSNVGVLYNYETYKKDTSILREKISYLSKSNIQFDLIPLTNEEIGSKLTAMKLETYALVIRLQNEVLNKGDQSLVNDYVRKGGLVIEGGVSLGELALPKVIGSDNIQVIVRRKNKNMKNKIIVHILNRDYNYKLDACLKKQNFKIQIPKKLININEVYQVTYIQSPALSPKNKEQKRVNLLPDLALLTFYQNKGNIEIEIPDLSLWGIVSLETI